MDSDNKLFLLDAYALIYRAYYAFIKNPRINSKGFNTSAVLGFVNTLEEVLKKKTPATSVSPSTRQALPSVTRPTNNIRHSGKRLRKASGSLCPSSRILSVPIAFPSSR